MAIAIEFASEKVGFKHLAADKALERQRCEHVEPEQAAGDVDHNIIVREIVLGDRGTEPKEEGACQLHGVLAANRRMDRENLQEHC